MSKRAGNQAERDGTIPTIAAPGETTGEGETRVILEQDQRLSQSLLWTLQRAFFDRQGIAAWSRGIVPHYITSNTYIAGAYARVVCGFLRDWRPALDPRQRVYIVELGSGSGRFAYHFLKKFLDTATRSVFGDLQITYVMTDFSERIIAYWQAHPSLQPLVAQGVLDFARFDAAQPGPITLAHAGTVLSPTSLSNPLVVLANYVFDSIPQDAFAIEGGQLYERLVTLSTTDPAIDRTDPELLNRLDISYHNTRVTVDYYDDPDFNTIVDAYLRRLPNTTLLFPAVALTCLRSLRTLSGDRLLLLSADKGYSREDDLLGRGAPGLAKHGSFSMMVNYHAVGEYVRNQGGRVLQMEHRHTHLNVLAYLFGVPPQGDAETVYAYHQAIEQGGPDDFFTLKRGIEAHYDSMAVEQLLAYLRLSGWDSQILMSCAQRLRSQLASASDTVRQELCSAIHQVWETYYPIGEGRDLAFTLGLLHFEMRQYHEALVYFRHPLRIHGRRPRTQYNIGLCHYRLRQSDAALESIEEALALDPAFGPARALRIKIQVQPRVPPEQRDSGAGSDTQPRIIYLHGTCSALTALRRRRA